MTRTDTSLFIERVLFATGVGLASWCALVLLEARFFATLPVPAPNHARAPLPGDDGRPEAGGATRERKTNGPASLRPGDWFARLDAPSVQLSATVLEGSDEATLARAAGHIEETAPPGETGNIGIAGHRDTTFRPVRHLKIGDALILTTADRTYEYRITWTRIVQPEDVYVLDPADGPVLTLVTCYPFTFVGHAPQRFIVRAALVAETPAAR